MLVIRTKDSELSWYSFTRPLFSVKLFNLTGNFSIITDCSLFLEGLPTRFLSVIILSISSLMSNSEFLCFFRKSSIAFCASGLQANGLLNDFFISASIDFFSFSMFFITLFSGSLPLITINRRVCSCTAVSYTHFRAHETKANLVCRLLLEKKKKRKKKK